jgi:NADH dehydrogenase/NADH:ubiquinone oxidoreductase subunit G
MERRLKYDWQYDLQAAEMNGVEIPRLCYDRELSPMGACRLCVVEVKGNRLLPASCVTPVTQGMEVETESEAVIEARKTVLELLIAIIRWMHACDKLATADWQIMLTATG